MADVPTPAWLPLEPGESVLWVGRPDPAVLFDRWDLWLVPFSLLFTAQVVTAVVRAWSAEALVLAPGGVLAVLVCVHLLVGRLAIRAWRDRRTTYVVTTRRVALRAPGRAAEAPLPGPSAGVRSHRDGVHVTAWFGPVRSLPPDWWAVPVVWPRALELRAVTDADALVAALDRVMAGSPPGVEPVEQT